MGVNLQDYLKNSILGNVRIGAKDERGLPIKIDHLMFIQIILHLNLLLKYLMKNIISQRV